MEKSTGGPRLGWAYWIACILAAGGGIVPILLAGTSGRISSVIIPFWLAALAFAASGVFNHLGRALLTVVYLAAGFAIAYGMLGMFAVLLQMSVLTTCPPGVTACALGFTRPLTSAETTGIGYAMGMGAVALLVGFAGLRGVYLRRGDRPESFSPPERRIAPLAPPAKEGAAQPKEADTGPAAAPSAEHQEEP